MTELKDLLYSLKEIIGKSLKMVPTTSYIYNDGGKIGCSFCKGDINVYNNDGLLWVTVSSSESRIDINFYFGYGFFVPKDGNPLGGVKRILYRICEVIDYGFDHLSSLIFKEIINMEIQINEDTLILKNCKVSL